MPGAATVLPNTFSDTLQKSFENLTRLFIQKRNFEQEQERIEISKQGQQLSRDLNTINISSGIAQNNNLPLSQMGQGTIDAVRRVMGPEADQVLQLPVQPMDLARWINDGKLKWLKEPGKEALAHSVIEASIVTDLRGKPGTFAEYDAERFINESIAAGTKKLFEIDPEAGVKAAKRAYFGVDPDVEFDIQLPDGRTLHYKDDPQTLSLAFTASNSLAAMYDTSKSDEAAARLVEGSVKDIATYMTDVWKTPRFPHQIYPLMAMSQKPGLDANGQQVMDQNGNPMSALDLELINRPSILPEWLLITQGIVTAEGRMALKDLELPGFADTRALFKEAETIPEGPLRDQYMRDKIAEIRRIDPDFPIGTLGKQWSIGGHSFGRPQMQDTPGAQPGTIGGIQLPQIGGQGAPALQDTRPLKDLTFDERANRIASGLASSTDPRAKAILYNAMRNEGLTEGEATQVIRRASIVYAQERGALARGEGQKARTTALDVVRDIRSQPEVARAMSFGAPIPVPSSITGGGNGAGAPAGGQVAIHPRLKQLGVTDPDKAFVLQNENGAIDPTARNAEPVFLNGREEHAFGLGQLIDSNRIAIGARLGVDPDTTNPRDQLRMADAYVEERYGSWAEARKVWERRRATKGIGTY